MWQGSVITISAALNLSELNLDGSHVIAKKGGEAVAYQGRKQAKTTNILPITDAQRFILTSTGLIAGNRHNAYNLKPHKQPSNPSSVLDYRFQGLISMQTRLLTPERPAKLVSIMV